MHGTPIWYELLTPDHAATKRFYDAVVGWDIEDAPAGPIDYRMIRTGHGNVGGVMQLSAEMTGGGAKPGWLFYIGVEDVDATAAKVAGAGGAVLMAPHDLPGVGRMAFLTDPQGAPFYVMRPEGEDPGSPPFAPGETGIRLGHCGWNELWTSDAAGAVAFYRDVFGWENPNTMDSPMGGYHFLHLPNDIVLGALAQSQAAGQAPRWNFYFWVPDVDAAIAATKSGGGAITMGPQDVPGGLRTIMGTDPMGATFALVGPGKQEN